MVFNDVHVALDGDREVFEGDIDLTPPPANGKLYGLVTRQGYGVWPNGVISAVVDRSIDPLVTAAINHWMESTPLRFIRGVGTGDYLSFQVTGRCFSTIGRRGGRQLVELSRDCTVGAVVHEIGHAVGLWHEHSRYDRDNYVTIIRGNIDPNEVYNFGLHDESAVNAGPYDLHSVMHYPSDAYSANRLPTIVMKSGDLLPPRQGLSPGDLFAVRTLYPQLNW